MNGTAVTFVINRMAAPHLPLDGFLALAKAAGPEAAEVRNDQLKQIIAKGYRSTISAPSHDEHGGLMP